MRITPEAVSLAKKYIRREPMPRSLSQQMCANRMEHLMHDVCFRTAELILENDNALPERKKHLAQILPCIAFYETLVLETGSKAEALALYEKWCLIKVERMVKWISPLVKLPGLYKQVPKLMEKLLHTTFGEKAGFSHKNVSCANGFSVDIIRCPYVEMCRKYNCMEIARFFCQSDDLCYGNIHPKLHWGRSQTLGTGGLLCDFKLLIKE